MCSSPIVQLLINYYYHYYYYHYYYYCYCYYYYHYCYYHYYSSYPRADQPLSRRHHSSLMRRC